jgi:hypothetical protein
MSVKKTILYWMKCLLKTSLTECNLMNAVSNGCSNEKFIKLVMKERKMNDVFFDRCQVCFASVTSFF